MRCEEYLEILDVPEELRDEEGSRILNTHLERCPSCSRIAAQLDAALAMASTAPPPSPSPAASALLRAYLQGEQAPDAGLEVALPVSRRDGQAHGPTIQEAPWPPKRSAGAGWLERLMPPWRHARLWVPGVALATLALWVARPPQEIRTKGTGAHVDPYVDLQAAIERPPQTGAPVSVVPVEDGARLVEGDGLLFSMMVQGGEHLVLIECDPEHRLKVIFERRGLDASAPVATRLEILGADGGLLRYVPNGPGGEYTYVAVIEPRAAGSTEGALGPADLDAIWNQYVDVVLAPLTPAAGSARVIDALRVRYDPVQSPTARDEPSRAAAGAPR